MITLYSTNCPRCVVLEKKLKNANISYQMVNDEDLMIKKGFMTAPILEVDGKTMNFVEANKWINERVGE